MRALISGHISKNNVLPVRQLIQLYLRLKTISPLSNISLNQLTPTSR